MFGDVLNLDVAALLTLQKLLFTFPQYILNWATVGLFFPQMEVVLKCTDILGLQQDSKTGTEAKFPALRHLTQTLSSLLRNAT